MLYMKTIEQKRELEKEVVTWMIRKYCKGNHKTMKSPCSECQELIDYAVLRSNKCPFIETKTFCNNCKVHCYKPEMKERIRVVMRYSGPRMLLYHPFMVINHMVESRKEKKEVRKNDK